MEITKIEELESWLEGRPVEVSKAIAARVALRVLPLLLNDPWDRPLHFEDASPLILPIFRTLNVSSVAAMHPSLDANIAAKIAAEAASEISVDILHDAMNEDVVRATAAAAACLDISIAAAFAPSPDAAVKSPIASACLSSVRYAAASRPSQFFLSSGGKFFSQPNAPFFKGSTDVWQSVSGDCNEFENGIGATKLMRKQLWPDGPPEGVMQKWLSLKAALQAMNQDWEVWTDWYEARLEGLPVNKELEIARVTEITEDEWQQGPEVINAKLKQIEARFAGVGSDNVEEVITAQDIPAISPAAITPTWDSGRLVLSHEPIRAEGLDQDLAVASLPALKMALVEMIDSLNDDPSANAIDTRLIDLLQEAANAVPNASPLTHHLIFLAHLGEALKGNIKTVEEVWPDALATRYIALVNLFDGIMARYQVWRNFRAEAESYVNEITPEIAKKTQGFAKEVIEFIENDVGQIIVDPEIPNFLSMLNDKLAQWSEEALTADKNLSQAAEALAVDIIESINNIFKSVALLLLTARTEWWDGFKRKWPEAWRHAGENTPERVIKWGKRISITVIASYGGISGLPSALKWWEAFIKYLQ